MISPISPIPAAAPIRQASTDTGRRNGGVVPPWLQYPIIILPIDDPDQITLPVITDPVEQPALV